MFCLKTSAFVISESFNVWLPISSILLCSEFVLGGQEVWGCILVLHLIIFYFLLLMCFIFWVGVCRFLMVDSFVTSIMACLEIVYSPEISFRCKWFLVFLPISRIYLPNLLRMRGFYLFSSVLHPFVLDYGDGCYSRQSQCCHMRVKSWL